MTTLTRDSFEWTLGDAFQCLDRAIELLGPNLPVQSVVVAPPAPSRGGARVNLKVAAVDDVQLVRREVVTGDYLYDSPHDSTLWRWEANVAGLSLTAEVDK